jgi:hypothetical protein
MLKQLNADHDATHPVEPQVDVDDDDDGAPDIDVPEPGQNAQVS